MANPTACSSSGRVYNCQKPPSSTNECSRAGCRRSLRTARRRAQADDGAESPPDTMSTITSTSTSTIAAMASMTTLTTMVTSATTTTTTTIAAQTRPAQKSEAATNAPDMPMAATIGVAVTATVIGLGIVGVLFFLVLRRLRRSSEDDDVPDFPHDKPDFGSHSPTPEDMVSIELRDLYEELTSPAGQTRLPQLQRELDADSDANMATSELPGEHQHQIQQQQDIGCGGKDDGDDDEDGDAGGQLACRSMTKTGVPSSPPVLPELGLDEDDGRVPDPEHR